MRALVQRVRKTALSVGGKPVSEIPLGLAVYLGVKEGDTRAQAEFIANPVGRVPMTPQDTADYKAFFHALHFIGYNARMSLECPVKNSETQLPVVLEVLHRCDNE